jgi:hypothetical protein
MLADIPAVAYTASWGGFLSAEFTANFKIDFFTSSGRNNPHQKSEEFQDRRNYPPSTKANRPIAPGD